MKTGIFLEKKMERVFKGVKLQYLSSNNRKVLRDGGRRTRRSSLDHVRVGMLEFRSEYRAKQFINSLITPNYEPNI